MPIEALKVVQAPFIPPPFEIGLFGDLGKTLLDHGDVQPRDQGADNPLDSMGIGQHLSVRVQMREDQTKEGQRFGRQGCNLCRQAYVLRDHSTRRLYHAIPQKIPATAGELSAQQPASKPQAAGRPGQRLASCY